MIRITVEKSGQSYTGFTSKGHAGYAGYGQDIVCAAVSALIINTVNSIGAFTDDRLRLKEGDGYISFHFEKPISEKGILLMDSLMLGLTEIKNSYDNGYLTIKVREV